jgi:hypothetical protein
MSDIVIRHAEPRDAEPLVQRRYQVEGMGFGL